VETFEDWLPSQGTLALRELAGAGEHLRALTKPEVVEYILATPDALENARLSWAISKHARAEVASMDPWAVRDQKIRHGLVD
jgi:hypothetical protein